MNLHEINGNRPGRKPLSTSYVKSMLDLQQDIVNATSDVAPYSSPAFRVNIIDGMIRKLTLLRDGLETDATIGDASATGNAQGAMMDRLNRR